MFDRFFSIGASDASEKYFYDSIKKFATDNQDIYGEVSDDVLKNISLHYAEMTDTATGLEQFKQIFAETINEILQDSLSINDIKSELKKKLVRNLVNEATSNSDKSFEIFKNNPDLKAKLTLIITNFIEENK